MGMKSTQAAKLQNHIVNHPASLTPFEFPDDERTNQLFPSLLGKEERDIIVVLTLGKYSHTMQ